MMPAIPTLLPPPVTDVGADLAEVLGPALRDFEHGVGALVLQHGALLPRGFRLAAAGER
jgi:hypothetical protein